MKAHELQEAFKLLHQTNPVLFRYWERAEKEKFKAELTIQFGLLSAEIHKKKNQQKIENHRLYWMYHQYELLIALLEEADEEESSNKTRAYLAYHHEQVQLQGSYFRRHYNALREDFVSETVVFLSSGNNFRLLEVVWGLSTLEYSLRLFADELTMNKVLVDLGAVANVLGNISWILYYIRLLLTLIRMIASEATDEEKANNTPWYKREAIHALKYPLLNDIFWGTTNLLCFMTFVGSVSMDYLNGVATAALLSVDLLLTICRVLEEHFRAKKRIKELEEKKQKAQTGAEREDLENAIKYATWELYYQNHKGLWDIIYAGVLVITWSALCAFFVNTPAALALGSSALPIALANVAIFNFAGAIGCFVISIIYNTASSLVDIAKANKFAKLYDEDAEKLLKTFLELKTELESATKEHKEESEVPSLEIKMEKLFLKIQELSNQSLEQKRQSTFQWGNLARTLVFDLIIPSLLIALVVAAPPTLLGIPILFVLLSAGLALSAASKPAYEFLFNRFWKPAETFPSLETKGKTYQDFKKNPSLDHFKPATKAENAANPMRTKGLRNYFWAPRAKGTSNNLPLDLNSQELTV